MLTRNKAHDNAVTRYIMCA